MWGFFIKDESIIIRILETKFLAKAPINLNGIIQVRGYASITVLSPIKYRGSPMAVHKLAFYILSLLFVGELAACPLPEKEILYILMQNYDVPLSVDSSCKNVGTDRQDKTIGEFISGFWAYHVETASKNWIKVQSRPLERKRCEAKVEIYGENGEEVIGGWGVSFIIKNANHKADRTSFKCLGSG